MSVYKALPDRLSRIHPTNRIPSYATRLAGVGTAISFFRGEALKKDMPALVVDE